MLWPMENWKAKQALWSLGVSVQFWNGVGNCTHERLALKFNSKFIAPASQLLRYSDVAFSTKTFLGSLNLGLLMGWAFSSPMFGLSQLQPPSSFMAAHDEKII